MNSNNVPAFMDALAEGVWAETRNQHCKKNCCIFATAIACDVVQHFEATAVPLVARLMAFNPAATRWIKHNGRLPVPGQEWDDAVARGAWSVGIGHGGAKVPKTWDGHLVAVMEGQAIIDASLPQASRKPCGMLLRPLWFTVAPEVLSASAVLESTVNGCLLIYETDVADKSFMDTPDWRNQEWRAKIVRRLIRKLYPLYRRLS